MESDSERLRTRIYEMIALHSGLAPERIRSESRLLHDLGINGDDAEYLLTDYSKTFQVDMSDFNFGKFFMGEPHLFNFWKFWFGDKERFQPLTVDNLCQSAAQKKFVYRDLPT